MVSAGYLSRRNAPPAPSTPADRFAWSARHDTRRIEFPVCYTQSQPQPLSVTTNSSCRPDPKGLPTRPIPPHSDPPAPPICTYEPPTLRHAPAIKPSYKHHVKLQNRSIFHPKSGADIAVTLNVPRQSFNFPGETMVSDPSSGAAGSFRVCEAGVSQ